MILSDELLYLFSILARLLSITSAAACIVFAILIIAAKPKSTKILGISFIIGALNTLMDFVRLNAMHTSVEMFSKVSVIANAVAFFFAVLSTLCLCFFIHKNYGRKFIYIPLLILAVLAPLANRFVIKFLIDSIGIGEAVLQAWILMVGNITNLVTGTVSSLIVILIFRKYRQREKVIPYYWIILTINFIYMAIVHLTLIAFSAMMLGDPHMLSSLSLVNELITLSGYFFALISPVYVAIMALKSGKHLPDGEKEIV